MQMQHVNAGTTTSLFSYHSIIHSSHALAFAERQWGVKIIPAASRQDVVYGLDRLTVSHKAVTYSAKTSTGNVMSQVDCVV